MKPKFRELVASRSTPGKSDAEDGAADDKVGISRRSSDKFAKSLEFHSFQAS